LKYRVVVGRPTIGLDSQDGAAAEGRRFKSSLRLPIEVLYISFVLARAEQVAKIREWAFGPFFVCRGFVPWQRIFCCTVSNVKSSVALVTDLVKPTVIALGLELWGIELIQQGKFSLLRIYIESEAGIAIEDCEKVSRQLSAILDVEDPIAGEYTLEVSSPGAERPLFTVEQYVQFEGSEVNLRLRSALDGRRKFKGNIVKVTGESISLLVDGTEFELVHSDIEKAHIVF